MHFNSPCSHFRLLPWILLIYSFWVWQTPGKTKYSVYSENDFTAFVYNTGVKIWDRHSQGISGRCHHCFDTTVPQQKQDHITSALAFCSASILDQKLEEMVWADFPPYQNSAGQNSLMCEAGSLWHAHTPVQYQCLSTAKNRKKSLPMKIDFDLTPLSSSLAQKQELLIWELMQLCHISWWWHHQNPQQRPSWHPAQCE